MILPFCPTPQETRIIKRRRRNKNDKKKKKREL